MPGFLVLIAAGAGFIVLSHGAAFGTLPVTGFLESVTRAISPTTAGRIKDVSVTLGQEVKAGDVLAQLDTRQLEAKKDELTASLAKAQAQLEAQRGIQDLQVMRAELWALRFRAEEQSARAELEALKQEMQTLDSLSGEHLVSAIQVVETLRKKQSVNARVQMYDEASARGQAGLSKWGGFKLSHSRAVAERLAPYELSMRSIEAEIHQVEISIEDATLKAPTDGRIAAILHRSGEVITVGVEVITLVTGRPGAVVVTAPEKIASTLGLGSRLRVRRPGFFRQPVEGVVIELSPSIDQAPLRAWASPSAPMWGRRLVIQTTALAGMLPGEAVYVQF